MLYGAIIIINLLILLIGYRLGRTVGSKEGYEKALSYIPLAMKIEYFKNNQCPICCKNQYHKGGKV